MKGCCDTAPVAVGFLLIIDTPLRLLYLVTYDELGPKATLSMVFILESVVFQAVVVGQFLLKPWWQVSEYLRNPWQRGAPVAENEDIRCTSCLAAEVIAILPGKREKHAVLDTSK